MRFRVLSLDCWRDESGWYENDVWSTGDVLEINTSGSGLAFSRRVCRALRDCGCLTQSSRGRVRVENFGDEIWVQFKNTGEPLFRLSPVEAL